MAENKKSFVLYKSWITEIEKLKTQDAGMLFLNIFEFVNGIDPIVQENIKSIYYAITEQIVFEWNKFNPKTNKYHWNYKGGITPENKVLRNSLAYKKWRLNVFNRDLFTCQKCFKKGCVLNAHHIMEFSKYPELRFEVSNGLTLCKECHIQVHKKEKEV